jgi:hypothetical protein
MWTKNKLGEQCQRLDDIGFVWDAVTQQWKESFAALLVFNQREGHCRVSNRHKADGYNLGAWLNRQRGNKGSLSPERVQRLEEIGFVWDTRVAPPTDN